MKSLVERLRTFLFVILILFQIQVVESCNNEITILELNLDMDLGRNEKKTRAIYFVLKSVKINLIPLHIF